MLNINELYRIYAGIFGALIGSFLNVVIYRLPIGKDLALERSHCPLCLAKIPWWHNIPVFSWIILRGKCSLCHGKISFQYFLVEILTATIFALSFPMDISTMAFWEWGFKSSLSAILICHFFIDLKHKLLLDILNIYLLCIILPFVLVFHSPMHWIIGGAFGFLAPMGVSWAFFKWKGKMGLGGGDIKLWGVLGLYLGLQGVIENIFFSCFAGSIVGIGLIVLKKYDHDGGIPFGPFIIVVAFLQIYFPAFIDLIRII